MAIQLRDSGEICRSACANQAGGKSLASTTFRKATTAVRLRGREAFFAISHHDVIGSTAHQLDTSFGIGSVRNDITCADAMACRYAKSIDVLKQSDGRFEVAVTTAKNRDWGIEAHKWNFSFHSIGASGMPAVIALHLQGFASGSTAFLSKRERTASARRDRTESPTSAAMIVGVNTDPTERSEPRSRTSPSPAPESE